MNRFEEPFPDVRILCEECAPKPNPVYRKWPLQAFIGKKCKLAFADEHITEHMWVHCIGLARASGFQLNGTLGSFPRLLANIEHGDQVLFDRSAIEDVHGEDA